MGVNIWILKLHLLHSLFKNIFLNPKIYKVNCNHTHFQLLFRQSPPLTMFTFHILLSALVLGKSCSAISPKPAVNIATICKGKNRKVSRNLKRMLGSLLNHSEHAIINLLVLTDKKTKPWVISTISNLLARQITEGVVFGYQDKKCQNKQIYNYPGILVKQKY